MCLRKRLAGRPRREDSDLAVDYPVVEPSSSIDNHDVTHQDSELSLASIGVSIGLSDAGDYLSRCPSSRSVVSSASKPKNVAEKLPPAVHRSNRSTITPGARGSCSPPMPSKCASGPVKCFRRPCNHKPAVFEADDDSSDSSKSDAALSNASPFAKLTVPASCSRVDVQLNEGSDASARSSVEVSYSSV